MKINEIISESRAQSQFHRSHKAAVKGMESWPDLDNGNVPYLQYRFGMALAGAPDIETSTHGPTGGQLLTLGYTTAEEEIIQAAATNMGIQPKQQTSNKSEEPVFVNTSSPVKARGPVALKSKKKK